MHTEAGYRITAALELNPITAVLEPARRAARRFRRRVRANRIQTAQLSEAISEAIDLNPMTLLLGPSRRGRRQSAPQHDQQEHRASPPGQRREPPVARAAITAALELERTCPLTTLLRSLPETKRALPLGVTGALWHTICAETGWSAVVSAMAAVVAFALGCLVLAVLTTWALHPPKPGPLSELDKARIARCRPRGVKNWRDLGGLTTADGKMRVRTGRVFRSGHLQNMQPTGEQAEELAMSFPRMAPRLRCVVDLRERFEMERQPDQPVAQRFCHAPFGANPANPVAALGVQIVDYKKAMMLNADKLFRGGPGGRSLTETVQLVTHGAVADPTPDSPVAQLLRLAADAANHPLNLHCTAGKDRCGASAAVLLLALGVSEETAMHDFLLTNHVLYDETWTNMVVFRLFWLATGSWYSFIYDATHVRQLLGVEARTLRTAMEAVHREHGGFTDAYWAKLGLDTPALARLRGALLEPITPVDGGDAAAVATAAAAALRCSQPSPHGIDVAALAPPPPSEDLEGCATALTFRQAYGRRRSFS